MAAHVISKLALLVISLIVAVISLPVTAAAISMPTWAKPLGGVGSELRVPIRVVTTSDGGFYVSDPRTTGIMKYSPAGALLKGMKVEGVAQSLALLPSGNLVVSVSTFGQSYAVILDAVSGLEIMRLKDGAGVYRFNYADGVAVDNGVGNPGSVPYVYIVDTKLLKVVVFDSVSGMYVREFDVRGAPQASYSYPTSIPVTITFEKESGLLAVVDKYVFGDSTARCIRFYDKTGTLVSKFGTIGPAGATVFTSPQSITFQYNTNGTLKRMYVVDTFNSTIQIVAPSTGPISGATTYSFLGFIGDYGFDATKGELHLPVDAAFDAVRKRLVVANGNGNVVYYGVDGGTTPLPTVTAPPGLTLDLPYSVVNTNYVDIAGSVAAGSKVSCALNGVPVATWSGPGTAWSCRLNNLTAGADNQIMVYAANSSPTTESKEATVKYVVNGPSIKVDPPPPPYVNTASLALAGVTDATTVQVCNPACLPATINGTAWSISNVPLIPGNNSNIEVRAVKNGITEILAVNNVIYDATAPKLNVSVVAHDSTVSDQVQNITGLVSDPEGLIESVTVNIYENAMPVANEPVKSQLATITKPANYAITKNALFSTAMVGALYYDVVARDLAGNVTKFPSDKPRNAIKYDPSKVKIRVTSADVADASVVTVATGQVLSGTIDRDVASMTVKGLPATINHGNLTWTASFNLDYDSVTKDGLNHVQISTSDGSSTKVTLIYDTANPEATIVEPKLDIATKENSYQMTVMDGTAVVLTYTFQGKTETIPSLAPFMVNFNAEGSFPVILSANDSNGASSQVVRNMIYDKTAPGLGFPNPYRSLTCTYPGGNISCVSACPGQGGVCNNTSFTGSVEPGASIKFFNAADNAEIVAPVTYTDYGKTWAAALPSRDPYNTIVQATDAAGNVKKLYPVAPDGNINVDDNFNQADVDRCMSKVADFGPSVSPDYPQPFDVLTPAELAHGDIGPLVGGMASPDGYIDIIDCLLISRKLNNYSVPY